MEKFIEYKTEKDEKCEEVFILAHLYEYLFYVFFLMKRKKSTVMWIKRKDRT